MAYSNLNAVINGSSPAALQALKTAYPGDESQFSVSRNLGERAQTISTEAPAAADAALAHAQAGDKANREQIDKLLAYARKKMRLAFLIKQSGAIGALLASAVTAYLVWSDAGKSTVTFITALAAAVGSTVATLSELAITSPSGVSIASPDEFAKLVALRVDAERIKLSLARIAAGAASNTELSSLLDEQDKAALQIIRYSNL